MHLVNTCGFLDSEPTDSPRTHSPWNRALKRRKISNHSPKSCVSAESCLSSLVNLSLIKEKAISFTLAGFKNLHRWRVIKGFLGESHPTDANEEHKTKKPL
uniref:uncharacterized protein LOC117603900 n=1 Tax=Osmia lignaria TaxID=473952 RepID=UPI001479558E|nr:uncharacterized protein LOC117603900 [Osmia lignaria]